MVGFSHLWYAEVVRNLQDAERALEKTGGPLSNLRDEEMFKEIHAKRMELWDLIKKVMVKGGADK